MGMPIGRALSRSTTHESEFRCQAIEVYSRALLSHPPNSVLLLSNRCASFCYLSKKLRQIPAAQSEARALYGLDPTSLAQVAGNPPSSSETNE